MATKKQQVADQTLKGAIVGVVAYVLAKGNVDAEAQAAIIPLVTAGLAYVSTLIGNKGSANFLDKKFVQLPAVVEVVEKVVDDLGKPAAKKAPAKKAAAKKTAPKA